MAEIQHIETKALLSIHYGDAFSQGSDSESMSSVASIDSEYERYRPPAYSYEDIKSRITVIEAGSEAGSSQANTKTDHKESTQEIVEKRLKTLIHLDHCNICDAKLISVEIAKSHYSSKRHQKKVVDWCRKKRKKIDSKKKCDMSYYSSDIASNNSGSLCNIPANLSVESVRHDMNETINSKLKSLTQPLFCHICQANLTGPSQAMSHYASKRHAESVKSWRDTETKKSKENLKNKQDSSASNSSVVTTRNSTLSSIQTDVPIYVNNQDVNETITSKLKSLTQPLYCHICPANLQGSNQAMSHYGSKRHAESVKSWCDTETKKLKENLKNKQDSSAINSSVVTTRNSTSSTIQTNVTANVNNQNSNETISAKLKSLTEPSYCHICLANLQEPKTAMSHYGSKRHAESVKSWCDTETKKFKENLKNKQDSSASNSSVVTTRNSTLSSIQTNVPINVNNQNVHETITAKLKSLTQPLYCHICLANLQGSNQAMSHYGSIRHAESVKSWCDTETKKLKENLKNKQDSSAINSSVVTTRNSTSSTIQTNVTANVNNQNSNETISAKLKSLTEPSYCHICLANLQEPKTAMSHYGSKRHAESVKSWCDTETKKFKENLKNKQDSSASNSSVVTTRNSTLSSIQTNVPINVNNQNVHETITAKLKSLTQPLYCHICLANLQGSNQAMSHYGSIRHAESVKSWCDTETKKLKENLKNKQDSSAINSSVVTTRNSTSSTIQTNVTANVYNQNSNETISGKLKSLTEPSYCHICLANLQEPKTAMSHYGSKRHAESVKSWCDTETKKFKENLKNKQDSSAINSSVVTTRNSTSSTIQTNVTANVYNQNSNETISGKLKSLTEPSYCHICLANLQEPKTAMSHYGSKRHAESVKSWCDTETKKFKANLKNKQDSSASNSSVVTTRNSTLSSIQTDVPIYVNNQNVHETITAKLKSLTQPLYCHICLANLQGSNQAMSHYGSKRHAESVKSWRDTETKKLKENLRNKQDSSAINSSPSTTQNYTTSASSSSDISKSQSLSTLVSSLNKNNDTALANMLQATYCYICNADLRATNIALAHYNSRRHADAAKLWLKKKRKEISKTRTLLNNVISRLTSMNDEKMAIMLQRDYCGICNANLQSYDVALEHYNSKKHADAASVWNTSESIEKSQSFLIDLISRLNSKNDEKMAIMLKTTHCGICNANLQSIDVAVRHYKSKKHAKAASIWDTSESIESLKTQLLLQDLISRSNPTNDRKMAKMLRTTHCGFCKAYLQSIDVALAHYNSIKHADATSVWHTSQITQSLKSQSLLRDLIGRLNSMNDKELAKMLQTTYCHICKADLRTPDTALHHYNSKKHADAASVWNTSESTKILRSNSLLRGLISRLNPTNNEKMANMLQTTYCRICKADLQSTDVALAHYNSKKHADAASVWDTSESTESLKSQSLLRDLLSRLNPKNNRKMAEMLQTAFCSICNASLQSTDVALAHYNSKEHADAASVWNNREISESLKSQSLLRDLLSRLNPKKNRKMAEMLQTAFCSICNASLQSTDVALAHYNSKEHADAASVWNNREISESLKSQLLLRDLIGRLNSTNDEKMAIMLKTNYCHICKANLPSIDVAIGHYNSKEHADAASVWNNREISESLKSQLLLRDLIGRLNSTNDEKMAIILKTTHCGICNANFISINVALGHYNSKRHADAASVWNTSESIESLKSQSLLRDLISRLNPTNNRKLTEMLQTTHCGICNARLQSTDFALEHYNSKKHADTASVWNTKQITEDLKSQSLLGDLISRLNSTNDKELAKMLQTTYCHICKADLQSTDIAIAHYNSRRHANATATSFYGLNSSTKAKILARHGELTKEFPENLKQELSKLLHTDRCDVCHTGMLQTGNAIWHYLSERHGTKVGIWYQNTKTSGQTESTRIKELCGANQSLDPSSTCSHCYVCKTSFDAESSEHLSSLAHKKALDLAYTLIAEGLQLQAYWFEQMTELLTDEKCLLCRVTFAPSIHADEHLKSECHKKRVTVWIKNITCVSETIPKAVDKKVCYCEVCDTKLDGTSRATEHYTGTVHQKFSSTYCQICRLQTGSSTAYQDHIISSPHLEKSSNVNPKKLDDNQNLTTNNKTKEIIFNNENITPEVNSTAEIIEVLQFQHVESNSENIEILQTKQATLLESLNKSSSNLDKKVSDELTTLANTIYYSKTIPFDVALDYLKKFNKDLDEVHAKFKASNAAKMIADSANIRTSNSCIEEKYLEDKITGDENNIQLNNEEQTLIYVKHQDFADENRDHNEMVADDTKEETKQNRDVYIRSEHSITKLAMDPCCSKNVQDLDETSIEKNEVDVGMMENIANKCEDREKDKQVLQKQIDKENGYIVINSEKEFKNTDKTLNQRNDDELFKDKTAGFLLENAASSGLEIGVLNRFVDTVSDGVLDDSVIVSCLKNFNEELDGYLQNNENSAEENDNSEQKVAVGNENKDYIEDEVETVTENVNFDQDIATETEDKVLIGVYIQTEDILNAKREDSSDNSRSKQEVVDEIGNEGLIELCIKNEDIIDVECENSAEKTASFDEGLVDVKEKEDVTEVCDKKGDVEDCPKEKKKSGMGKFFSRLWFKS